MEKLKFGFDTGFGDVDPYTSFGAGGYANVYTDVSMSSEDEQPYTATGNGTGVFMSADTQNGIFNLLGTALNYALLRDQQKMTAVYGPQVAMSPQQAAQLSVQASGDRRLLMYAAIGLGLYLLVRK